MMKECIKWTEEIIAMVIIWRVQLLGILQKLLNNSIVNSRKAVENMKEDCAEKFKVWNKAKLKHPKNL